MHSAATGSWKSIERPTCQKNATADSRAIAMKTAASPGRKGKTIRRLAPENLLPLAG